jgi:hypothetical protein
MMAVVVRVPLPVPLCTAATLAQSRVAASRILRLYRVGTAFGWRSERVRFGGQASWFGSAAKRAGSPGHHVLAGIADALISI